MAQVVAHKTLRNSPIGLGGKPYRTDDHGILSPQPTGSDLQQILLLRAMHLVDDTRLGLPHPGLEPPAPDPDKAETPPPPTSKTTVDEIMQMTRALDAVEAPDSYQSVAAADLNDPHPEDPGADDKYLDALSRDDLLEVARSRGLPGLKGKTKAQLLTMLKGG